MFSLRGANVPPKQVPSRDYLAEPLSLRPELSTAQDRCDWFKEMQTTQRVFHFSYPRMHLWCSQTWSPQHCGDPCARCQSFSWNVHLLIETTVCLAYRIIPREVWLVNTPLPLHILLVFELLPPCCLPAVSACDLSTFLIRDLSPLIENN